MPIHRSSWPEIRGACWPTCCSRIASAEGRPIIQPVGGFVSMIRFLPHLTCTVICRSFRMPIAPAIASGAARTQPKPASHGDEVRRSSSHWGARRLSNGLLPHAARFVFFDFLLYGGSMTADILRRAVSSASYPPLQLSTGSGPLGGAVPADISTGVTPKELSEQAHAPICPLHSLRCKWVRHTDRCPSVQSRDGSIPLIEKPPSGRRKGQAKGPVSSRAGSLRPSVDRLKLRTMQAAAAIVVITMGPENR